MGWDGMVGDGRECTSRLERRYDLRGTIMSLSASIIPLSAKYFLQHPTAAGNVRSSSWHAVNSHSGPNRPNLGKVSAKTARAPANKAQVTGYLAPTHRWPLLAPWLPVRQTSANRLRVRRSLKPPWMVLFLDNFIFIFVHLRPASICVHIRAYIYIKMCIYYTALYGLTHSMHKLVLLPQPS